MPNRDEIFFELEPAALAANGPLPLPTKPVLPPQGTYPSGEELARRLERFVNMELNAIELKVMPEGSKGARGDSIMHDRGPTRVPPALPP